MAADEGRAPGPIATAETGAAPGRLGAHGGRRTPGQIAAPVAIAAIAAAVVAAAISFTACTTFIGDDHLFLAFARYTPSPFVAFVRDQHGGEFYRPLPMLLWWALARVDPGAEWPFAALGLVLHALVALELALLVSRFGDDRRAGVLAGLFFFVSPFNRETAYWYAASTDLLAAAAGLGAIHALLAGGRAAGAVAAVTAAIAFDFFHTRPYLRLTIESRASRLSSAKARSCSSSWKSRMPMRSASGA